MSQATRQARRILDGAHTYTDCLQAAAWAAVAQAEALERIADDLHAVTLDSQYGTVIRTAEVPT